MQRKFEDRLICFYCAAFFLPWSDAMASATLLRCPTSLLILPDDMDALRALVLE
jgi:hypothetical protein